MSFDVEVIVVGPIATARKDQKLTTVDVDTNLIRKNRNGGNCYIYYIHPELRMSDCRFRSGKGVWPLQREHEGSKRGHELSKGQVHRQEPVRAPVLVGRSVRDRNAGDATPPIWVMST